METDVCRREKCIEKENVCGWAGVELLASGKVR